MSDIPDTISSITDMPIEELTEEFPLPVRYRTSSSSFLNQEVEVLRSSTERIFNCCTFDVELTIDFEVCPGTIIVGDLADWPNIIVAEGTLIVTNTTTTIET